ncbi:MAG: SPFH domain-containing protein [Oscillospiraceae bacterium]|nr:SPFH domain-containing protein [Oscillospiraceae bacterium]
MEERKLVNDEIVLKGKPGIPMLLLGIFLLPVSVLVLVFGVELVTWDGMFPGVILIVLGILYLCLCWMPFAGLKVIKPNEALVLTLFGKYYGTLKEPGIFFVNPFVSAVNPTMEGKDVETAAATAGSTGLSLTLSGKSKDSASGKKLSMKALTLNNGKQKINDQLGNPIEIGVVVIWRVQNTAKAVFNVDNYMEFLSIQTDSALRNIVRLYPYDMADGGEDERSLRGSSQMVAEELKAEIQNKVEVAGLEILEARITHLAYAPEIAAAMLQRQQASAIIDARKMIVDGAVGMVEMALEKLSEGNIVELDEERKAAMVSNLLVVLCGSKDAQPIVNSGSIY